MTARPWCAPRKTTLLNGHRNRAVPRDPAIDQPDRAGAHLAAGQKRCIGGKRTGSAGEIDIVSADVRFAGELLQPLLLRLQRLFGARREFHIAEIKSLDRGLLQYLEAFLLRPRQ